MVANVNEYAVKCIEGVGYPGSRVDALDAQHFSLFQAGQFAFNMQVRVGRVLP